MSLTAAQVSLQIGLASLNQSSVHDDCDLESQIVTGSRDPLIFASGPTPDVFPAEDDAYM